MIFSSVPMDAIDVKSHKERALSHLRENNTLDALFHLDKIFEVSDSAEVRSAYALCIALERGQVKEAIDLCIEAVKREPENAFHYLNLGRIYLKGDKKAVAIDIFRKGLRFDSTSEASKSIISILEALGLRKRSPLPFLRRDHVLNKYMGLFLSRLGLR